MNENIRAFLEKLGADEDLQKRFAQIRDPEEAYRVASEVQGGFTKEEFLTEMTKMKESLEENLTDEDLAQSSGGGDGTSPLSAAISISGVVTMSAVTAAFSASL